jgi:hypothetical protein
MWSRGSGNLRKRSRSKNLRKQSILRAQTTSRPAADLAPPGPVPGGTGVGLEVGGGGPAAAAVKEAPLETAQPGRGKKLAGVVLAASGLALVGTGIAFGVFAKRDGDQLTQLDQQRGVFDPSTERAGRLDQRLEGVCIVVGAAAVATGAILYLLGARAGRDSNQAITVLPAVAAHSAGATLRMVF